VILETVAKQFPIDFILYIGDDTGNESVFSYLNNKKAQTSKLLAGNSSVYTCTIGRKAT
jgi:trehalose-6-phosphatase